MTTIAGTVDNTSTITVSGGNTLLVGDSSIPAGATLEGAGTVTLSSTGSENTSSINPGVTGAVLTNVNNTIEGLSGSTFNGAGPDNINITVVNEQAGVVEADGNSGWGVLNINVTATNSGTFAATGGGQLQLAPYAAYGQVTINDTSGGVLDAAGGGSQIILNNGVAVEGGTLETSGGGVIAFNSGLLDGSGGNAVTNIGGVGGNSSGGTLTVEGAIVNEGSITLNPYGGDNSSTTLLTIGGTNASGATLSGGGQVILGNDSRINSGVTGAVLTNVNDTIEGQGGAVINGYGADYITVTLVNDQAGVVEADGNSGFGLLDINANATNFGTLAATGGGELVLNPVTINDTSGGVLDAAGSGSQVILNNGVAVEGGTLETSGGGVIAFNSGLLDGSGGNAVTNIGGVGGNSSGGTLTVEGAIVNEGSITLNPYGGDNSSTTLLTIGGTNASGATLSGGGQVILGNDSRINSGVTGAVLTNVNDTIEGQGGAVINGYGADYITVTLVNDQAGVVEADGNSGFGLLDINANATNFGTLAATGGGELVLNPGTINDTSGGVLDAAGSGSQVILNGATVEGGTLETSGGGVIVANGNVAFYGGGTIAGAINGSGTVSFNGGNVTLAQPGDITASTVNFNAGTLFIEGGTINAPNLSLAANVDVTGYGAIGDLQNNGVIDAAGSLLTINGHVTGSGSLRVETGATLELAGATAQIVTFEGTDATVKLDAPSSFTGAFDGFAVGDTIDLAGVTLSAVSIVNGDLIGTLAAGGTLALSTPNISVDLKLTLVSNSSGSSISLAPTSAVPEIITPLGNNNSIALPDVHVSPSGTPPDQETLAIANTATAPADGLTVGIGQTTGNAYGTGSITSLAPGATNGTSIAVGLNDTTAGAESGTVALAFESDGSVSGVAANLVSQTINLTGSVYRYATPSVTAPSDVILHVGDDGGTATEALTVANTDPADSYSEGLDAAATGVITGNLISASGSTGDVAAGGSDSSSLTVSFSTATAATIDGSADVGLTSDGTGVDTLGLTSLGTIAVPVTATIDNDATADLAQTGGNGTLTPSTTPDVYTLNLGATTQFSSALSASLEALNAAQGPAADLLNGNFSISGNSEYSNSFFDAFSGITFGNADTSPDVFLNTGTVGTFNETIVLNATGSNASGYSGALTAETIDVVGTILPVPEVVVSSIAAPTQALSGQEVPITWTLSNDGDATAVGPWSDEVFVASDAAGDNGQLLGTFVFEGTIAAGQTISREVNVTLPVTLSGDEWIVVKTDSSDQLVEPLSAAAKQTAATEPTVVTPAPSPDLVVTSITAPTTAFSGQQTQVSWTVTNTGDAGTSASSWYDNVYLSLDQTLDATNTRFVVAAATNTDPLLASVPNPTYLAPGQSYTSTATVTLPQGISGPYYIIVGADAGGQVYEDPTGVADYTVSSVFGIRASPVPDLHVTSVLAPPEAFSGQPITLTWTVENTGASPTGTTAWTDEILMSTDGSLDANSTVLGTVGHTGALVPGSSYTNSASVTLPVGVGGDATFFVVPDYQDQVYEGAGRPAGDGSTATTTQVNITPPPELEVSLNSVPTTALAGHSLSFSYQVTNDGATATPNTSWTANVYLSSDPTLDSNATLISSSVHYGALDVGQSYTASGSVTLSSDLTGPYYLIVQTDSTDQVFQLDRSNDVAVSAAIAVANEPPDLVVSSVTAPAGGQAGDQVEIGWQVTNTGTGDTAAATWSDTIVLSASGVFGASDNVTLGTVAGPAGPLVAGASYSQTAIVSLPLTLSGNYTLFVVTDSDPLVSETSENSASAGQAFAVTQQLADLQVVSVSAPTSDTAGQTVTVNWTVDNSGSAATNATYWYDDVYVSTTPNLSGSSVLLGQSRHVNTLAAGGSYSASASFVLPADLAAGPYYFIVAADADDQVTEVDHSENTGTSAVSTLAAAPTGTGTGTGTGTTTPPELAVSNVSIPTESISGQTFTVSYTESNLGGATLNSWYDAVYLSRNQVLGSSSDIFLGYVNSTGLAAGASQTITQTFTIPDGQSGPFWVIVVADAGDALSTDTGQNNSFAASSEIEVDLPAVVDLNVGTITVPTSATVGGDATFTYTVNNLSSNTEQGSWYDALYLSPDDTWSANDPLIGEVLVTGGVGADGSYTETLTAPLPSVAPGNYYVVVRTDIKSESAGTNATGVSSGTVSVDVPTLTLGTPATGALTTGEPAAYYQFTVAAGQTVNLSLTSSNATSINNIYVGYNALPTVGEFDVTSTNPAVADPTAVIEATQSGTYYVMVLGDSVGNLLYGNGQPYIIGQEDYTLTAQTVPFSITNITPEHGSNLGSVTLTIDGAQFNADEQVEVIAPDGTVRTATTVDYVNSTEVWATFNLEGLPVGTYSVEIGDGTQTATLPQSFDVTNGPTGAVSVSLVLPQYIRAGQNGVVQVDYTNTGDTDVAAPVLDLSSAQALLNTGGVSGSTGDIIFLGTNASGPAGILPPGAEGSVSFSYTPINPTPDEYINFSVSTLATNNPTADTIDWSSLETALRPATVDATDWNNVWTDFIALVGTTTTSEESALSQAATELSQVGQPTKDIATLLQYELFQASGAMAGTSLDYATDIAPSSSSLSLSLDRCYDGTLLGRDATGEFGDGWTSNYDITAVTDSSGNVYIQSPSVPHVFTLQANGTYTAETGDPATLTVSNGLYQMDDGSGDVYQFGADGDVTSITDSNGNVINLTYNSAGVLQQVASATTGETITFASNAQGLITSATGSDGEQVTYTYNAAGTQLLSATGPAGVTSYSYAAPTGSVNDNALTSITNPDGAQEFFTYNSLGWLASQSGADGTGLLTYSYNGSGQVTITNALGDPTTLLYGSNGEVAQTQDALGNATQLQYNAAGDLTGVVSPGNSISSYSYNALGDLTGSTDPLGGTISATYAPGTQNLTGFTNQLGSQIQYTYNAAGDVTGITYQDGSGDTDQYNTAGLLTSSTDADGNTIDYSYNSAGELTKESFSDGTSNLYTYDASGNLLTATAQNDTTETYAYNSANQLTSMTDPTGQVESWTYNANGRLATQTEPDGSVTQYSYNAAGQLTELQDGSGNLLDQYTYDAAGQLVETVTGNGASTTYLYDTDGRTTEILNRNADGSVASFYDYTYNANSQVVAEDTSDGNWTYSYDAEGELTSAVFQSTNATIQNQDISYVYDAAGNRISQTANGVATDYTTNALNQYTAVGGTTYTYDADGNMTSETNSSGTTTFTYNESNQLIAENGPGGTFQYAYDALGNLVSTTQNGVTTDYVNDPLSMSVSGVPLTSISQVYNSTGTLEVTYDYGLGLAAVADSAGDVSYYNTDLAQNVTGLSGPNGSLSSTYFYLPFGQVIQTSGTAGNPFQFAGGLGVTTDGSGLDFMRARGYDASLGRFTSPDPAGIGASPDLYTYAGENPVNQEDPSGLGYGQYDVTGGYGGVVVTGGYQLDGDGELYFVLGGGLGTPGLNASAVYSNGSAGGLSVNDQVGVSYFYGGATGGASYNPWTDQVSQNVGGTVGTPGPSASLTVTYSVPVPRLKLVQDIIAANLTYWYYGDGSDNFGPAVTNRSQYVTPHDPNDIFGPAGFGPENFVSTSAPLAYTIDFENASTATAPAQDVTVTTQLDPNLDWSTFRLTGFGFDNLTYSLSGDAPFYTAQLDLTATKGYIVDVSAGVNIATGVVTWTFDTIDPSTGQTPTNPLTGFLPVDDANNDGDAYVSYTVQANPGVQTGDVVDAQATVVFDTQGPINTAAISNTLDVTPPTSEVEALPAQTNDTTFEVDWSGQDDPEGPGIASYTIYVSTDGGPMIAWLTDTTQTNALFTGALGHTYAFSSVATDYAGVTEAMHATPDTTILVGSDTSDVTIAATNAVQPEGYTGTTPFTFTVARTGDLSATQTVAWVATGSGNNPATAANFAGDVLPGGTVTFAPGETSETITVNVAALPQVEPDLGFTVTLSNPSSGITIDTASVSGTIQNDFSQLSIAATNADEEGSFFGTTPFTFTVSATGETSVAQTVSWAVTGSGADPASGSAFSGGALPTGTVTFAPGQTSQTITVNVAQITALNPDEGFTVTLSNPSTGMIIGTASAAGTIEAQPAASLTGDVFDWKSHALLSGVSLSEVGAGAPGETGSAPVTFQNARIGANGDLEVDVYANAGTGVGNFDLTVTGPSGGTASFASSTLPAGWTLEQNQNGGTFSVAAIGLTDVTGQVLLGTLTWSLPAGTTAASVALTSGRVGDTTIVPQLLDYSAVSSTTAGGFAISTPPMSDYSVTASLGTSGTGNAINSADALAALKLAVGINPNPVSAVTGTAPMVSPYQFIAADVTGSGKITAVDALDILKMAVHLPSAPTPQWEFVNAATSYWDPTTHAFTVNRLNVPTGLPTSITATAGTPLDLVGILTGDVTGSLAAPAGSSTVTPSEIVSLSQETGAPVDQWGVASYSVASALAAAAAGPTALLPVDDTAADVSANIDGLETMSQAGELSGIWLTDSGTPAITVTAAQFAADSGALSEVVGGYTLDVNGTGGSDSVDLATTSVPAVVSLGGDTASVSSGLTAPSLTFIGTPDAVALGTASATVDYKMAASSGVEEVSGFAYGLDTLDIALNGVTAADLTAVDTSVGGQHAVFISNQADPSYGVVLAGLGASQTAADLLANHLTVANGYATVS